jgi:iron(III) transport system permease protein
VTPEARVGRTVSAAWVLAVGVVFAGPLLYLALRTARLDDRVVEFLTSADTWLPLSRTLVLAAAVGATTAALGTTMALLVVRTDLPGRRVLRVLAPLPLVLPSFVGATALLAGLTPGGLVSELLAPLGVESLPRLEGFWGSWFVLSLFTYPLVYLPVAARLSTLPGSLEESARLLGRTPWAVAREVLLPQARTSIAAGSLLVVLYTISDFGVVSLLRYGTLTQQIYQAKLDPSAWLPLSLVLAVVAVTVTVGERVVARRSHTMAVARGRRGAALPLGRWRWPAAAAVLFVLANALLGPLAVLAYWAVRGYTADSAATSLDLDPTELVVPALSTVGVSVAAAVVAVAAVLPVARAMARRRGSLAHASSVMIVAGYALPGLVVALALVFWSLSSDAAAVLYQTLPLLILAYTIHFGAQAMRTAQVAVEGVPDRMQDAARVLGASAVRRLATVELPIMVPGLLAGAGLVMVSAMKELPATLVLSPPGFSTLATRVWDAYEYGSYAQMGLAALALVAVSGFLTWALVIRRAELL